MTRILLILSFCALVGGCSLGEGRDALKDLPQLETRLERGLSKKDDVERLFGSPSGKGNAVFPLLKGEHEIWYYEDFEMTGASAEGGLIELELRQQILMVFFKGDTFDGFLWTSNKVPAEMEERFHY